MTVLDTTDSNTQTEALAALLAKKFIQRKDAKAKQHTDGSWFVHGDRATGERLPWKMGDLRAHIAGTASFGHYMLDQDGMCKLFAFDLDLGKTGTWVEYTNLNREDAGAVAHDYNPRETWMSNWRHPSRSFVKTQMRELSNALARSIHEVMQIPVAIAYSGAKGMHVYGFTGVVPAAEAREAAQIVLDDLGCWEPSRGKAFFRHKNQDPLSGYPSFSLEVFPKQDNLNGKDLGNLMRLPFGRNTKAPKAPAFIIDTTAPYVELRPHRDPVAALETGNPWA